MAVRLLLSEVYPRLYAYGQELGAMDMDKPARPPFELEALAIQKLEELDFWLLHCLVAYQAEAAAKRGCIDGYRSAHIKREVLKL